MPAARTPTAAGDWARTGAATEVISPSAVTTVVNTRLMCSLYPLLSVTLTARESSGMRLGNFSSQGIVYDVVQSRVPDTDPMTTTAPVAGLAPAPKNLLARFIGIIVSPKETFQAVAAAPKVLGILLLTCTLAAVFTALPMTTEAGKQAAIDKNVEQMKSLGFTVTDQMYDGMQRGAKNMPYTTGVSVFVFIPIVALIFSGILL